MDRWWYKTAHSRSMSAPPPPNESIWADRSRAVCVWCGVVWLGSEKAAPRKRKDGDGYPFSNFEILHGDGGSFFCFVYSVWGEAIAGGEGKVGMNEGREEEKEKEKKWG